MNIVHGNIFVNQKQASCEADVLSCYYLHALNNTEAVRLVIFPSYPFILLYSALISIVILVTFIIRSHPSLNA